MKKNTPILYIIHVFFILILLKNSTLLFGQEISGTIFEMDDKAPVEFVNISITSKNVATVSDKNGKYTLQINPEYRNDTLRFSSIGYHSYCVKVSDFMKLNNWNVTLEKKVNNLEEVIVRSKKNKEKRFMQRVWGWFTSCRKTSDTNENEQTVEMDNAIK